MKTTTAELDKQQNPDAERNTGDSNWLLPSENRTRRKHYSTHAALLFSALSLPAFTRKHAFPPTKFQHISQNILPVKKKTKVHVKMCFCQVYTLFQFLSVSVNSPLKRYACKKKTFHYIFYSRTVVLLLSRVFVHVSGLISWRH